MPTVFVSHVEEDAAIAVEIAAGLEAAGFSTWYYERDSVPGVSYLVQVGEAIERSSAVVLLVSRASLGSHQVTTEVVRAYEARKPILPITIDVSHDGFQRRQPEWRTAIGAATSISMKSRDAASVTASLVAGLGQLGVERSVDMAPADKPARGVFRAAEGPRTTLPPERQSAGEPRDHVTTQLKVLNFKLDWTEPPYSTMRLHIDQPLFKNFPGEWFRQEDQPNAPGLYRLLLRGPGIVSVCRDTPYELLMGKAALAQVDVVRQHIQESLQAATGAQQVLHVASPTKPRKGGGSRK